MLRINYHRSPNGEHAGQTDGHIGVGDSVWWKPGTLAHLAIFVDGDWTRTLGVSPGPRCRRSAVYARDREWIENTAEVCRECVDAAFWVVAALDLISRIRAATP